MFRVTLLLALLVGGCATVPTAKPLPSAALATPQTFTLVYSVPRFQADSLDRCLADSARIAHPDSARLIGYARVKAWPWWPAGWYAPRQVTLAHHALTPGAASDSFSIALPIGADSTFSVGASNHSRAGWSQVCRLVGITVAK